jgi:hypothetical protein
MHLGRHAAPLVLGCSLLPLASGAQVVAATDDEVIRGWQQAQPGSPVPVLTAEGAGTRLTWSGSATFDAYSTRVRSGAGHVSSPLGNGEFGKAAFQGDARWVQPDGTVDALMFRTLHTNDRAVLPRTAYQLGNLQAARTSSWYSLAAGDVAPNFSKLSSALGVRGLFGQVTAGPAAVSGFTGRVAESWEALGRPALRSQPVHGARREGRIAARRDHARVRHHAAISGRTQAEWRWLAGRGGCAFAQQHRGAPVQPGRFLGGCRSGHQPHRRRCLG